jgi:hypothetical protein
VSRRARASPSISARSCLSDCLTVCLSVCLSVALKG